MIYQILGKYLTLLSLLLCLPLGMAVYYEFLAPAFHPQPHSTRAFLAALLISLAISGLFRTLGRNPHGPFYRRESILAVVLIWLVTSVIASLPFTFSGTLKRPLDAYFEAMSGLTTTGVTLLCPKAYNPATGEELPVYITNPQVPTKTYSYYGTVEPIRDPSSGLVLYTGIEAVSRAVLFWRSLLQWIGGIGIVVIFLYILPALGVGGKFLYQMEMTGPVKDGIAPRIQNTANFLLRVYLLFTLAQIALLLFVGLPPFDALCTSLSTISTGGFAVRNDSIASYGKAAEWIIALFMILGSINFSLYFHAYRFKFYKIFVPDFLLFLALALLGCLAVSIPLLSTHSVGSAIREGFFQALSVQSTTGFFTANYDLWPFASQMFMLLLMFVGGMSGSTAGGIKTSRFYILYKIVLHRLESLYRPDSVRKLTIGSAEIDDKSSLTVLSFFCIVAFFAVLGTVGLVLDGVDPETAFGLIASLMNNVGLAFRGAGPTDTVAFLSPFSKILSLCWMLLGRLEFYVVLLLFLPSYWRSR